jgi:hypothetical protein
VELVPDGGQVHGQEEEGQEGQRQEGQEVITSKSIL